MAKHYALLPAWQPIAISILAPLTLVLFLLGQAQRGKSAIVPAPFSYMALGVTIVAVAAVWMLMCRTAAMIDAGC